MKWIFFCILSLKNKRFNSNWLIILSTHQEIKHKINNSWIRFAPERSLLMSTSVTRAPQVIYILCVFAFVVLKKKKKWSNSTEHLFDFISHVREIIGVEVMHFNEIRALACVLKMLLDIINVWILKCGQWMRF